MSTANAIITGTLGPDKDVTSIALSDVKEIRFEIDRNVIMVRHGAPERISYYDYAITATVTYVITAGNAVITIA